MINKVSVTGNIAKIISNGQVSLLIARHEEYWINDEVKEKTDFMWVKTSQKVFEKHTFQVGDLIEARGKLSGGQYQDKQGVGRTIFVSLLSRFLPIRNKKKMK